jgi:DNA-binding XRE family transcriptional regulator
MRSNTEIGEIRRLYSIICNRELGDDPDSMQKRVDIIMHLESVTGKQFRNTKEFHEVVSQLITREGEKLIPINKQFRIKRSNLDLDQAELAKQLNVDRRTIIRWEKGSTPLTPNAIQWIYKKDPSIDGAAGNIKPGNREQDARI